MYGRRLAIAGGALALLAATTCGADAPRDVIVLWSANDQWVKIVPQDDPAASPNEHPAHLATETINNALAALQVRIVDEDSGTETQRAVFTREELKNLAPRVASGLAQAGPRQDVVFSTTGSHALTSGGTIKAVGVNAGRVFYDDGKLNVIFGELQSSYRKKNLYGQITEDFTPRRQGSRDKAAEQKLSLAQRPGVEFHSVDGAVRDDWIAIDSTVAASQASAASQPASAPGSSAPASDAAKAAPAAAAAGTAAGKSSADVEQRLQKLKDLKDKGLISEEAYRARMQEILSEL
jgi:hypothetical protein